MTFTLDCDILKKMKTQGVIMKARLLRNITAIMMLTIIMGDLSGCGKSDDHKQETEESESISTEENVVDEAVEYTEEDFIRAVREYYADQADYYVASVNVIFSENDQVQLSVYLSAGTDSDNEKGYEEYVVDKRSGKGTDSKDEPVDLGQYLADAYAFRMESDSGENDNSTVKKVIQ